VSSTQQEEKMKISKPKLPNWRVPHVAMLLGALAVAVIAVPAWAKSDDGLEDEFPTVPGAPGPGPAGFVARAQHPGPPLPPGIAAAMLHAGEAPGADQRDESIQLVPPPEGLPEGLPPHPPEQNPFPLSDEEIEHLRQVLQDHADCLRDHGQDVGDPQVGRFRIVIRIGDQGEGFDPFSEEFQQAQEACGGPPPVIGDESGESDTP
jgi:hypothetical protein